MADTGEEARPATVVEMRVHGVGGTSPENLLDFARPEQVAGDDISGFYARPDRTDLEAYSWGGLTSRSGSRALWLLLLPFGLANVAGWLIIRPPGEPSTVARIQKALVRLVALLITAAYVLWIGQVTVDIVSYQCGGQAQCIDTHWWVRFFNLDFFGAPDSPHVARRLAVGMVVPLALIALLTRLGKTSRNRYEEQFSHEVPPGEQDRDPAMRYGIGDDPFWHSSPMVERLTRLHIAVALVAVAGAASDALWRLERTIPGTSGWERVHFGLMVACIVVGVLIVGGVSVLAWVSRLKAIVLPLVAAALAAIVALSALARTGPAVTPGEHQILPGWGRFSLAATTLLLVLVITLGLFNLFDGTRRKVAREAREAADEAARAAGTAELEEARAAKPGAGFRGFGPFTAATFGALVLAVTLAGTVVRIADWLGDRAAEMTPGATVVEYSNGYDWLAVSVLLVAAGVLVAIGVRVALLAFGPRNGWRRTQVRAAIDREYDALDDTRGDECKDVEDQKCRGPERDDLLRRVARLRRIRSALGSADGVAANIALVAVLVATGLFAYRTWQAGGDVLGDLPPLFSWLAPLLGPATWLATLLPLLFLLLLRQAYRNPTTRRRVGIMWDVVTFWPRWYHPLAPPSYATRAVPQLTIRLRRLLATTRGTKQAVVLSAHSQGTVVAAATVLRLAKLDAADRRRLALITHGSPLRRLYGKYFPAHFGPPQLAKVRAALASNGHVRWRNLYRLTDPIGGAVFGEQRFKKTEHGPPIRPDIDVLVADPPTDWHAPGNPCPPPLGHSNYFSTPLSCACPPYDRIKREMTDDLAAQLRAGPAIPTSG